MAGVNLVAIETTEPWKEIIALVREEDEAGLQLYLDTLSNTELARALTLLDNEAQGRVMMLLAPEDAADLLEELSDPQGADIIEELRPEHAAVIFDEMESDHRADVLAEMDPREAEAILRAMDPEEAEDARHLLEYPENVAGGIMVTEYLVYRDDQTVEEVLQDMRANREEYRDYRVQHAYVENERGTLVGVLRMQDLPLSPLEAPILTAMIPNPVSALVTDELAELDRVFSRFNFMSIPVVGSEGKIRGVVMRADLEEALGEASEKALLRFGGIIGGDELRSMPTLERTYKRLVWLVLNLFLCVPAAFIILLFEGTIEAVTMLAAVIPVIANMCGCAGNQAVAVSIRELALGIIEPRDYFRVFLKEQSVAVINGLCLGCLMGLGVGLVEQHAMLGVVVGTALALNTLVAGCFGGVIPLGLHKLHIDPALAAAPMLMSFVDMTGFLIVLTLASVVLL